MAAAPVDFGTVLIVDDAILDVGAIVDRLFGAGRAELRIIGLADIDVRAHHSNGRRVCES